MGTPEFAAESLKRLYNDKQNVVGVFTQADKPKNRGMKMSFSPVKQLALLNNTPVYQPVSLKSNDSADIIKGLNCDIIVVVAYGKKLPNEILAIPPLGCINIHGSVLPKYRGAAPIQHAVLNDEKETGVTSQYISEEIDTGDIIKIKKTDIGEDETSQDLFIRLSGLGAQLLSETLTAISDGSAKRSVQKNEAATYAPMLCKEMSPIDWNKNALAIKAQVRGLYPWPVATMQLDDNILKVFSVDIEIIKPDKTPGTILSLGKNGIEVACTDGIVTVKEIQAPGGKRMLAADYLRGRKQLKDN